MSCLHRYLAMSRLGNDKKNQGDRGMKTKTKSEVLENV